MLPGAAAVACERAGNVAVTMFTLAYTTSASSPATRSNVCLWDATMSGWAELLPVTARLLKVSLVATFAASLVLGSSSMGIAADDGRLEQVRAAEQRLLGSDDEAARFAACQPFTREIAVEGAVVGSFDASLKEGDVPATAALEVRRALSTVIDLGREVAEGDHFYVRYQQTFTLRRYAPLVSLASCGRRLSRRPRDRSPSTAIARWVASSTFGWRTESPRRRLRYACPSTP